MTPGFAFWLGVLIGFLLREIIRSFFLTPWGEGLYSIWYKIKKKTVPPVRAKIVPAEDASGTSSFSSQETSFAGTGEGPGRHGLIVVAFDKYSGEARVVEHRIL